MAESNGTWTIRRLLQWTPEFFQKKGLDQPRLSAELLLSHVLKLPRIALYTDYERILDQRQLAIYRELVRRAADDEAGRDSVDEHIPLIDAEVQQRLGAVIIAHKERG